jgi:hypothetical protein
MQRLNRICFVLADGQSSFTALTSGWESAVFSGSGYSSIIVRANRGCTRALIEEMGSTGQDNEDVIYNSI